MNYIYILERTWTRFSIDTNKGKELIKKWEDSINLVTIIKAELQEYITTKIY